MDFLIDNWLLILVALTSGAMLAWPRLQGGAKGVTPGAAVQLINREKAVVIDVCDPAEYSSEHIAGARNVPLAQLESGLPAAAKNKGRPLIFVCASGARAGRAVTVARKLGYEDVRTLAGGLKAWRDANLPTERG
ncbi:MAG: rhodanese-like domain-containing protein [Ottowia sp.]|nr:rhodanese-like domain-containing protein [Ottowia sp.]